MRFPALARLSALTLATVTLLSVLAGPAAAHGRGSESTNFISSILEVDELPGVTWEVYGGDQYLGVTNTSDTELIVQGYSEEPYLRIGPDGVFENQASEAAYVNEDRYGEVGALPPDVGADHEPRWAKVSDDPTYAWHDHRIHWMSPQLPPAVVDPSQETVINPWQVPFSYGNEELAVSGELRWQPPPPPWPWLALALVLTAPALLGLRRARGDRWVSALVRPAAAVLFAVSVLNITHLVDDFLAVPVPLSTQLVSAVQTALFIALGLFGALLAWRGRDGAFTALGVGAAGILVGQGLLYLDAFTKAASASVFPDWLARLVIALSLIQALFVGAVAVIGNRRLAREADTDADEVEPVATSTGGAT